MTSPIGKRLLSSDASIPANLIRQWCYCPRVVYYRELAGAMDKYPLWVEQGEDFHRMEEKLWERRNLSRFGLQEGRKHYRVTLRDEALGLHGIADMAIETEDRVYAIEYKLSASGKKRGDLLQLTAYAMLLERHFSKPCPVGFLIGSGKVLHTIEFDDSKREAVAGVVNQIRHMMERGMKPSSSASIAQCSACEYVNYCNDRL